MCKFWTKHLNQAFGTMYTIELQVLVPLIHLSWILVTVLTLVSYQVCPKLTTTLLSNRSESSTNTLHPESTPWASQLHTCTVEHHEKTSRTPLTSGDRMPGMPKMCPGASRELAKRVWPRLHLPSTVLPSWPPVASEAFPICPFIPGGTTHCALWPQWPPMVYPAPSTFSLSRHCLIDLAAFRSLFRCKIVIREKMEIKWCNEGWICLIIEHFILQNCDAICTYQSASNENRLRKRNYRRWFLLYTTYLTFPVSCGRERGG